jgi:hypothetical protein
LAASGAAIIGAPSAASAPAAAIVGSLIAAAASSAAIVGALRAPSTSAPAVIGSLIAAAAPGPPATAGSNRVTVVHVRFHGCLGKHQRFTVSPVSGWSVAHGNFLLTVALCMNTGRQGVESDRQR